MNLFKYKNKNTRTDITMAVRADFIKFRHVILTADSRQTRRKDNVVYKYGPYVGNFYRFTDGVNRGVFVRSVFGLELDCTVVSIHDLTPVNHIYLSVNYRDAIPALKAFGYSDWFDFYKICETSGLRARYIGHGAVEDLESSCNVSRVIKSDSWIVIAGNAIPKRFGYSSMKKLIETYKAVTGKNCIFKHGHLYLEIESSDNGIVSTAALEVF